MIRSEIKSWKDEQYINVSWKLKNYCGNHNYEMIGKKSLDIHLAFGKLKDAATTLKMKTLDSSPFLRFLGPKLLGGVGQQGRKNAKKNCKVFCCLFGIF